MAQQGEAESRFADTRMQRAFDHAMEFSRAQEFGSAVQ